MVGNIFQVPFSRVLLLHNGKLVDPTISLTKQGFSDDSYLRVFMVAKGYEGGRNGPTTSG
jgi:hypothetical protein